MTPEVLQEKFLDWQCQSRIQAFRTQNGRPNSSMAPILLDKKGNELLRIIVVISENDPVNTTKLFEHTFKRTYDPADRFDKMNKFYNIYVISQTRIKIFIMPKNIFPMFFILIENKRRTQQSIICRKVYKI